MLNIYCKMRKEQLKSKEEFNFNKYYTDAMTNMESVIVYSKNDTPRCRICLQKAAIYIFEDDKTDVIEALQIFVNINLNEDEECPKHLCRVCFKFIREVILFRNTAIKADNVLRRPKLKSKPKLKIKIEACNDDADSDDNNQNEQDFNDTSIEIQTHNRNKKRNFKLEACNDADLHENDQNEQDFNDTTKKIQTPKKKVKIRKPLNITKEQRKQTNYKAKTVPCPICNKIYFKAYLQEHITIHEQVKPLNHVCDVCGKGYRLKTSLARHVTTHRKDFPYECKFCPYKAKDIQSLKLHTRVHTRDYKYKCDQCPAKYIAKPNLNRHMLTHKEPQFRCEGCPKAFYTNSDLRNHNEAIHLGMKKHICNLCDKAFGFRKLMMRHQLHFHKREKMKSSRVPIYLQEGESERT